MMRFRRAWGLLVLGLTGWALAQTPLGPGTYTLPPGSTIVVPTPPPTSYTLGVTVAGPGVGTAGPSGTYPSGQVVALTSAPAAGSTFAGWSGDADCADGSVTMTANRACVATFALVPPPAASALGQLAASMAPGTWAPFPTQGVSALYAVGSSQHIVGDASKAVWDPVAKRLHFIGSDHGDLQQHVVYDEATNTWSRRPRAAWMPTTTGTPWHGYQHTAIDPVGRKLWHRPFVSPIVRELDLTTGVWRDLPTYYPAHQYTVVCCAALVWFPERSSLLFLSIESGTLGAIAEYKPATGAWTRLASGFPLPQYAVAEYVTQDQAVVFGAGVQFHHLNAAGTLTRLPDAPFSLTNTGRNGALTHDPVSGNLLAYADRTNWATFSLPANAWAPRTTPDVEVIGPPRYTGLPLFGHIVGAVSTHGVSFWARCHYADTPDKCRVWLYKHGTPIVQPPSSTFTVRCAAPGVVMCQGFDSETAVQAGHPGYTFPSTAISFDPAQRASGAGSMKCTVIDTHTVSTGLCAWRSHFMPGGLTAPIRPNPPRPLTNVIFKEGDEFYVQWRQRFSTEFFSNVRGDGPKHLILTDPSVGSCLRQELPMTHYNWKKFPVMYHSCGAKIAPENGPSGAYEGLYEPVAPINFRLQNAIRDASAPPSTATNCLYNPATVPPCIGYVANEWMTFKVRVRIGTWYNNDGVYKHDSIVQAWLARQALQSVKIIDFSQQAGAAGATCTATQRSLPSCQTGYDLLRPSEVNQITGDVSTGYAGLFLTSLDWRMVSQPGRPTAYTWYDELIVSRQDIVDPS